MRSLREVIRLLKARTCLASSVVCSDGFLGLPKGSQALYLQMSLNADSNGILSGVRSLIRQADATTEDFEALADAGYLLEIGGEWVICDWWVSNVKSKTYAATCKLIDDGLLEFEGKPYSSRYSAKAESRPDEATNTSKDNPSETNINQENPISKKEKAIQGAEKNACPRCRETAFVERDALGVLKVDCPRCGFFTIDGNGEIIG